MIDGVFIFKRILTTGRPISNNRCDWAGTSILDFNNNGLNKKITVSEIDVICYNYVFIIDHDYDNQYSQMSLVEYIEKFNVIPDQVFKLLRDKRCALVLDASFEGFCEDIHFNKMYEVVDHYSLSADQFIYVTSAMGATEINRQYCQTYNKHTPIRVETIPLFKHVVRNFGHVSSSDKEQIVKKFMCLNNALRLHRVVFGSRLYHRKNLIKETYLSFPKTDSLGNKFDDLIDIIKPVLTKVEPNLLPNSRNFGETIYDMRDSLPLMLDPNPATTLDLSNTPINKFYDQSLFNIVTETQFYESIRFGLPTLFLTEKIFKPMLYLQIPIILGGPGLVQEMRNMGFDMFDDIVDHSYDTINDHDQRMDMVLDQIEKINSKYSLSEINDLAVDVMTRLKINRDKLFI